MTISGKDAQENFIGIAEVYLADYRFADNSLDYVLNQWLPVDLQSLRGATSLEFVLTSSDVSGNGDMMTPGFFALDSVLAAMEILPLSLAASSISENDGTTTGAVGRNDADLSQPLVVTLSSNDTSVATVPDTVTIPAGEASVDFPITAVDNAFVEPSGFRPATILAIADGYLGASVGLGVINDDVPTLTASVDPATVVEGQASTFTVTRNTDTTDALTVTLAAFVSGAALG